MRVLEERDDIAYGKVFFGAGGYITKEWYPYFLTVRRQGFTFDEGYAKLSDKRNDFDYQGPVRLYQKAGFVEVARKNGQVVMRKIL